VNGVGSQPSRVVAVGVATSNREEPLSDQFRKLVSDLSALPLVTNATSQLFCEAKPLIGRLEKDRTTVGTTIPLVELHDDRLAKKTREKNRLLCGNVFHAKASVWRKCCVATAFYHVEAFFLSDLVNYPG
jgi:hypothetical protein